VQDRGDYFHFNKEIKSVTLETMLSLRC